MSKAGAKFAGAVPTESFVCGAAVSGEETEWMRAPLSFTGGGMQIKGGTISWNEETNEWKAEFPSIFGRITLAGTYKTDGSMTVTEDSTGGPAAADIGDIQQVFIDALHGIYQEPAEAEEEVPEDNALSDKIESVTGYEGVWQAIAADIARKYDPELRNHDTIFYGASNFSLWKSMEDDLAPYSVENHAFGGSTDKDLLFWAPYLLYPYEPAVIFFQTGSNDYVNSTAETDELKIREAMDHKKQMFAEFHTHLPEAKMVVMSGILLPGRKQYVDMTLAINDQLKEFCDKTEYMIYIDAESLTYDREKGAFVDDVENLFLKDKIHLTDEARIAWAGRWMIPVLEKLGAPKKAVDN